MAAPTVVWIRDGVGFTPEAANSWRRLEARNGSPIPTNSTYRDYNQQMSMFLAWDCYVRGMCGHPGHSRALHPDESVHCKALAVDTDAWAVPGFVGLAAEYGWIRTAASDPTERHHFEYQAWNDRHRWDPVPAAVEPVPAPPVIDTALLRRQREDGMYVRGASFDDVYHLSTQDRKPFLRHCAPAEAAFARAGGLVVFGDDDTLVMLANEAGYYAPSGEPEPAPEPDPKA